MNDQSRDFSKRMAQRRRQLLETTIVKETLVSLISSGILDVDQIRATDNRALELPDLNRFLTDFPISLRLDPAERDWDFLLSMIVGPVKYNPLFDGIRAQPDSKSIMRGDEVVGIVYPLGYEVLHVMHNYPFFRRSAPTGTRLELKLLSLIHI